MAVTREKKEQALQELNEKFSKSKSVVFAGYRSLDMEKQNELRSSLRTGGNELKIGKKTLMMLAARQNGVDGLDPSMMEGPVAATFSYQDPLSGLKTLFNFSKKNESLKLLGGIIDGKPVGPQTILEYAKLPGREELLAKLMGSMKAPVSGMAGLMNNLIAGFVRVVNGYAEKKAGSSEQGA